MAIHGVGTDIVEVDRIRRLVERSPDRVRRRLYTEHEWAYAHTFRDPYPSLAARFAAKEAGFKALRIPSWTGFSWRDIEVCSGEGRIPDILYHRGALALLQRLGVRSRHVSLAHLKDHAIATVILET